MRPASVITDLLYNLGDVGNATTNAALIAVDAAVGLNFYMDNSDYGAGVPFNAAFAALTALTRPDEIGSLVSYVAQLYGNPAESFTTFYTYPWYFKDYVLEQYANVLPAPLGQAVNDAVNDFAERLNGVLSALPDPSAAAGEMANLYNTDLGRAVYAVQAGIVLPVNVVADLAYWASYVPADVEASFESAIQNPSEIPGLISYLAYTVVDPDLGEGLLGNIAYALHRPLVYLPGPIGGSTGLAENAYQGFVDGVNNLLTTLLPPPVVPTPFPTSSAAPTSAAPALTRNTVAQQQVPGANTDGDGAKAARHPEKAKSKAAKDGAAAASTKPSPAKPANGAPNGQRHAKVRTA